MIRSMKFFIGNVQFTVETDDIKDAFKKMQFFNAIPERCAVCDSELVLNFYNTGANGNHDYYGVRCVGTNETKEQHQLNFHEYKEGKGFYIKDGEGTDPMAWKGRKLSSAQSDEQSEPARQSEAPRDRNGAVQTAPAAVETDGDLDKMAESILGSVKREDRADGPVFVVGAFEVKKGPSGGIGCDCRKYINSVSADPKFACEHIRAARLFVKGQQK